MTVSKFYSYSLILSFGQTMASASLTLSVSDQRSDKDIMIIFQPHEKFSELGQNFNTTMVFLNYNSGLFLDQK